MSKILICLFQGRAGNQTMQYLFARAWAEKHGYQLQHDHFVGEDIFDLGPIVRPDAAMPRRRVNETELYCVTHLQDDPEALEFQGYAQMQECMIYTKRQAQDWLKLRPEINAACTAAIEHDCRGGAPDRIVCHLRHGDYAGYGYPMVARQSYDDAMRQYGFDGNHPGLVFLSEEDPTPHLDLVPDDISFVVDFVRMMRAPTLLRANSTFSWIAGLLNDGIVLSPIIDRLEGGKEHLCKFIPANWPRLANLDFTTNLHVEP